MAKIDEVLTVTHKPHCFIYVHLGPGSYEKLHFQINKIEIIDFLRKFDNRHDILINTPKLFIFPISIEDIGKKTQTDAAMKKPPITTPTAPPLHPTLSEIVVLYFEAGKFVIDHIFLVHLMHHTYLY